MRCHRAARARLALGAAGVLLVGVAAFPAAAGAAPARTATASRFDGVPTVGALFLPASSRAHNCTASVVDSPKGDLLITAAHCLSGTAVGDGFAPEYHDGTEPFGMWKVTAAYGSPSWLQGRNSDNDYAFLVVADRSIDGRTRSVQSVTGANQLGTDPAARTTVTVPAYDSGYDDRPITCTAAVYFDDGYPAFNCNPYVDGTSGAPWLHKVGRSEVVVGVIGGLHHGGCYASTSYSAPFGSDIDAIYKDAATGMPPSTFPGGGSDGCSTGL
jgi:hypothetical protein